MDFTFTKYKKLISSFLKSDYQFQTFQDFIESSMERVVIFRHDVDRLPQNSLQISQLEAEFRIKSTYYFRMKPCSYDENIIRQIADLGHEIGYHYENLSDIWKREKGKGRAEEELNKLAIQDFEKNLEKLRNLYPVKTICMHGSPLSKYDNRELWTKYDYRTEGIIGEPYLDVDWNEVFYLTDTGRLWDGGDVSIRDKIQDERFKPKEWPVYHSTQDIITAVENGTFPQKAVITTHPQRWTNNPVLLTKEFVWQNLKNVGKRLLVKREE